MARIRTIKPEFFDDPKLGKLAPLARLAFIGLLTQADSKGRIEDEPERLKVRLLPYDNIDMDTILSELARVGVIVRYEADARRVIQVTNFDKHQRPHPKEAPSLLPEPAVKRNGKPRKETASREKTRRAVKLHALSGSLDTGVLEAGEGKEDDADASLAPAALQTLWNTLTTAPIARCLDLSPKRSTHAAKRLLEHPPEWWEPVILRIQASDFCRGQNDRGWVASFDWLIGGPDSALKVLEGKYDNRPKVTAFAPAKATDDEIWADIEAQKALRVRR